MSYNTEIETIDYSNEWINWIEEAISEKYIKYYTYEHFYNVEEIGSDSIGKFYRANWKNSHKYLILKSFFNFNNVTIKEIVHEMKLHRQVGFHDNIIQFYGITISNQEDQDDQYLLVMEYADGGTLQDHLKKNFDNLTWNDKFNLALQLAYAVSYLHDEGIAHRDLHSGNILVHQNVVKLADLGLSKRIEEGSKLQSKLFGIIPYVDPKRFSRQKNSNNGTQIYELNDKSDVYSVGVLLWEISSGQPPFYCEDEPYDIDLAIEISQGLREKIIPNTPIDYANLYTECWDNEPDNRPTMNQIVERLKSMMNQSTNVQQTIDHVLINIIHDKLNEGKSGKVIEQYIIDYLNNNNISLQEAHDWFLNNQNILDSIFLLGYFNFYGIGINKDHNEAFNLFINASGKNHVLAHYYAGLCYEFGHGTVKDENLALKYYEKIANKNCVVGEFKTGYFYDLGIGIQKNEKLAVYWYKKAACNGHLLAMHNLGLCYKNEKGVEKNYIKAFRLFKRSAEGDIVDGITMLGYCYNNGIGTDINKNKAFELYKKAANLGNDIAQYNLAIIYENVKDMDRAIHWYEKSAKQKNSNARIRLEELLKKNNERLTNRY